METALTPISLSPTYDEYAWKECQRTDDYTLIRVIYPDKYKPEGRRFEDYEFGEGEEPSLAQLQEWVGAGTEGFGNLIEYVSVDIDEKSHDAVVNEEGLLLELEPNTNALWTIDTWPSAYGIAGAIVIWLKGNMK